MCTFIFFVLTQCQSICLTRDFNRMGLTKVYDSVISYTLANETNEGLFPVY